MNIIKRIGRHLRISGKNLCIPGIPLPSFLTLFINSDCNLRCEHCFYWKNLNSKEDLTKEEIFSLSNDLGRIENLYLSGGEPFIRKEFSEICRYFIKNNYVEQIYVPTNAYYTKKTVQDVKEVLKEDHLKLLVIEISLDGTEDFHNNFRGSENSFQKAIETYDVLADLQRQDSRLRIHAISTANSKNLKELHDLTTYLYKRCSAMDHHNISMIRGDRRDPELKGPDLIEYQELIDYVESLWKQREDERFGSIMEPMLQWAKIGIERNNTQVVPCRAGILNAVVYANGDVSVCEERKPVGNLRQRNFREIWLSTTADSIRASIKRKECCCTNVIFLYPSIAFNPIYLIKAMTLAIIFKKPSSKRHRG